MSELRPPSAPALRSGAVLALFSLAGCGPGSQPHSPTLDLLGSYFPAWMLCAAAGVITAAVIRQVLAVVGIGEYVVAPLLTYVGLALSATWLIWLLLYGY